METEAKWTKGSDIFYIPTWQCKIGRRIGGVAHIYGSYIAMFRRADGSKVVNPCDSLRTAKDVVRRGLISALNKQ